MLIYMSMIQSSTVTGSDSDEDFYAADVIGASDHQLSPDDEKVCWLIHYISPLGQRSSVNCLSTLRYILWNRYDSDSLTAKKIVLKNHRYRWNSL